MHHKSQAILPTARACNNLNNCRMHFMHAAKMLTACASFFSLLLLKVFAVTVFMSAALAPKGDTRLAGCWVCWWLAAGQASCW